MTMLASVCFIPLASARARAWWESLIRFSDGGWAVGRGAEESSSTRSAAVRSRSFVAFVSTFRLPRVRRVGGGERAMSSTRGMVGGPFASSMPQGGGGVNGVAGVAAFPNPTAPAGWGCLRPCFSTIWAFETGAGLFFGAPGCERGGRGEGAGEVPAMQPGGEILGLAQCGAAANPPPAGAALRCGAGMANRRGRGTIPQPTPPVGLLQAPTARDCAFTPRLIPMFTL